MLNNSLPHTYNYSSFQ